MKSFIKKLLKQKLNEVKLSDHFLERSEDRVWGNQSKGPASINAGAYVGTDVVDNMDMRGYDEHTLKHFIKKNIPISSFVKKILNYFDVLENKINFKTKYAIGIIFWKSSVTYTGKGQNPPGNSLVGIMRDNIMVTLQWQPAKDVNIGGGMVTDTDMLLPITLILQYVKETGITTLTDEDVRKINIIQKGVDTTPKTTEPIVIINGVKYSVDMETGNVKQKNGAKSIFFDDLPDDVQEKILSIIN